MDLSSLSRGAEAGAVTYHSDHNMEALPSLVTSNYRVKEKIVSLLTV